VVSESISYKLTDNLPFKIGYAPRVVLKG